MARLPFPQDRTAFLYTGSGQPIRQPWETQLTLYRDQALTTLADVRTLENGALPGSMIFIQPDGLIPEFLGPDDGLEVLWAKPPEEPAYPLTAKYDASLKAYTDAKIAALVASAPGTLDTLDEIAAALNDDNQAFVKLSGLANHPLVFSRSGDLGALTLPYESAQVLYNDTPYNWEVQNLRASVGTAPVGAGIAINLKKNGNVTVVASVTIADGAVTGISTPAAPKPVIAPGDYVHVNVVSVGSTTPGADLTLQAAVVNKIIP